MVTGVEKRNRWGTVVESVARNGPTTSSRARGTRSISGKDQACWTIPVDHSSAAA